MRASAAVVLLALAAAGLSGCAGRGREVFVARGCPACHRFRGPGGSLGPDLSDVASRMDAAAMRAQITGPAAVNPGARMPPFADLNWYDLHSVISYLRSPGR